MNFLQNYELSTRYRICQVLTFFTPFFVKRRSFRALFYMFFASGFLICPEFLTAVIFDRNQMALAIEQKPEFIEANLDETSDVKAESEIHNESSAVVGEILEDKKDF